MALRRGHLECGANCWPDAVTSSQWNLIGLLLSVVGFPIALLLIWVGLRWIIEKIAAAFRRK